MSFMVGLLFCPPSAHFKFFTFVFVINFYLIGGENSGADVVVAALLIIIFVVLAFLFVGINSNTAFVQWNAYWTKIFLKAAVLLIFSVEKALLKQDFFNS